MLLALSKTRGCLLIVFFNRQNPQVNKFSLATQLLNSGDPKTGYLNTKNIQKLDVFVLFLNGRPFKNRAIWKPTCFPPFKNCTGPVFRSALFCKT